MSVQRKVVYGINLTADGCCDHTKGRGGVEIHEYFTELMRDVDLVVYGRKTYELMVPYWPNVAKSQAGTESELAFARTFTALDKVVFSTTLTLDEYGPSNPAVREGNTRVIRGNLKEEFLKLKHQPGGTISLGGVDLPSQLVALGLVDEFFFVIHPVIAGEGRRLFDDLKMPHGVELELANATTLSSGFVALHYIKP